MQLVTFKKELPTSPPDPQTARKIIDLAKSINAGRSENHASKSSWLEVTRRLSEQDRQKNESSEQAFTRFIQTEDGRELFKAYRTAAGPDFRPVPQETTAQIVKAESAYGRLKKIAEGIRTENPALTEHQAFAHAFADPANRELADLSKRENAFA